MPYLDTSNSDGWAVNVGSLLSLYSSGFCPSKWMSIELRC